MKLVLIGAYIAGALFTFAIGMLFAILGGKSKDLFLPFWWALTWPYQVAKFLGSMFIGR